MLLCALVLVSSLQNVEFEAKYDIVDFFAGAGWLARGGRCVGETCAALDIGFHENPRVFDINSDAGFMSLKRISFQTLRTVSPKT